jgi:hypothetical protein
MIAPSSSKGSLRTTLECAPRSRSRSLRFRASIGTSHLNFHRKSQDKFRAQQAARNRVSPSVGKLKAVSCCKYRSSRSLRVRDNTQWSSDRPQWPPRAPQPPRPGSSFDNSPCMCRHRNLILRNRTSYNHFCRILNSVQLPSFHQPKEQRLEPLAAIVQRRSSCPPIKSLIRKFSW